MIREESRKSVNLQHSANEEPGVKELSVRQ